MTQPPSLGDPATLDDLLLYRLSRLVGVAGSLVIRLCEGRFGITRREWRLLALLAQDDDLRSSELAGRAQLDRARTSKAITSLVGKKLVRRETRPSDRRQVMLSLSAEGHALYQTLFPLVVEINRNLLAVLPTSGVHDLDQALNALQRQADVMVDQTELPKADRRRGARRRQIIG